MVAGTSRARLAVLHVTHGALVLATALHLRHHLILTYSDDKGIVSIRVDNEKKKMMRTCSRTFQLVP